MTTPDSLHAGRSGRSLRIALSVFLAMAFGRLIVAWIVPVVQDEAYYIEWSRALDWGYFDHPPGTAWVNVTSWLAPESALMGRLGSMLVAALGFPFVVGLLRRAGVSEPRAFLAGLVLVHLNFFVLISGTAATPDAILIPAWCAALHEAAAALQGKRRRWLTAGLATGIGLLGKYTMVLIGPVFLWALIRSDRRALATPWPYAGGLVALLVFLPHLAWNAENEWIPIRMQLQHGMEGGHDPGFEVPSDLPAPAQPAVDGPEMRIGRRFGETEPALRAPLPPEPTTPAEVPGNVGAYIGALLGFWGLFLIPLGRRLLLWLRRELPPEAPVDPGLKPLLMASVWVPILVFFFFSLTSHVEANWASVYMIGAGVLLAAYGGSRFPAIVLHGGINLVLCLLFALYISHPEIVSTRRIRVLGETLGWPDLAAYCERLEGPVLTAREQQTSMLRFYADDLPVTQYPGITQPSEFVRRAEWQVYSRADLHGAGGFWLVDEDPFPPCLEGFEPVASTELRWCLPHGLATTDSADFEARGPPCDDTPIHVWFLVRYRSTER